MSELSISAIIHAYGGYKTVAIRGSRIFAEVSAGRARELEPTPQEKEKAPLVAEHSATCTELLCKAVVHGLSLPINLCRVMDVDLRNGEETIRYIKLDNSVSAPVMGLSDPALCRVKPIVSACSSTDVDEEHQRLWALRTGHTGFELLARAFFNLLGVSPLEVELSMVRITRPRCAFQFMYRRRSI